MRPEITELNGKAEERKLKTAESIRGRKDLDYSKPMKNKIIRPNETAKDGNENVKCVSKARSVYEEVPRELLYSYPGNEVTKQSSVSQVSIDGKVVNIRVSLKKTKSARYFI